DAGNPVDRAVGIAAILADPEQYADELALIRGAMGDDGRLADGRLTVKANNREYLSYGVQSVAGLRLDLGPATSEVEIGLRLHHDEADRFQWADAYAMADGIMNRVARGTPGTDSNRIDDATAAAAFAQAEVRLGRLTLTPG